MEQTADHCSPDGVQFMVSLSRACGIVCCSSEIYSRVRAGVFSRLVVVSLSCRSSAIGCSFGKWIPAAARRDERNPESIVNVRIRIIERTNNIKGRSGIT